MKKFTPLPQVLALSLVLSSCGSGEGDGQSSSQAPRYNVVLISMDSVRPDRLGIYGHKPEFAPDVAVTPHLDALAQEGVVFDEAWATSSWTLPSHMTMMTGLTDAAHGVVHDFIKLDPAMATMAEQFQQAGYQTAGFFSGPYLDPKYGFGRGFDFYESGMMPAGEREVWIEERSNEILASRGITDPNAKLNRTEIAALRDRLSHEDITSPRINELGMEFLNMQGGEQPFFLFLHYFDAHYDHIPEKMEAGLGKKFDPEYQGDFSPDRWYFNEDVRILTNQGPIRNISERDLRHIMAWYDAEIHWVDRHIGEVLAKLEELGLADNTIVAVVADHGDEFFEHSNIGHRTTLFPEVLKVPFVLKVPGEARAGARVPDLVRLYDLAPTLLDYSLRQPFEQAEGQSVRPLVEQKVALARDGLGHLTTLGPVGPNVMRAQTYEVWRDGRYSLHRMMQTPQPFANGSTEPVEFRQGNLPNGQPYFFFDRQNDPFEQNPLPPTHPEYRKAIERFQLSVTAHRQHRAGLPDSGAVARYPEKLTAEEIEMLIALGYMEENTPPEQAQVKAPLFKPYPVPGMPR